MGVQMSDDQFQELMRSIRRRNTDAGSIVLSVVKPKEEGADNEEPRGYNQQDGVQIRGGQESQASRHAQR